MDVFALSAILHHNKMRNNQLQIEDEPIFEVLMK